MRKFWKWIQGKFPIKYSPEWQPRWVVRDGKTLGPFMFSTKWIHVEDQAKIIFGDDLGDSWRKILKETSYNTSYEPPENHIHLARHVISHLESQLRDVNENYKKENNIPL